MTEMNTPGKIAIIHIQRSAKEIEFVVLEGLYIVYMSFWLRICYNRHEIVQPIEIIPIKTEPEER